MSTTKIVFLCVDLRHQKKFTKQADAVDDGSVYTLNLIVFSIRININFNLQVYVLTKNTLELTE